MSLASGGMVTYVVKELGHVVDLAVNSNPCRVGCINKRQKDVNLQMHKRCTNEQNRW